MTVKNKYVKHTHISKAKFRQIILLFSEDLSATQISHLTELSRQTINKYLMVIRFADLRVICTPLVGQIGVDGIELFWGYTKNRLVKFKGMNKSMFNLHLKECEFRFNQRGEDMYQILLKLFRNDPLKLS